MRAARLVGAAVCLLLVVPAATASVVLMLAPGTALFAAGLWLSCLALAGGAWHLWPGPSERPLPPIPPLYGSDADVRARNTAPLDAEERLAFLSIVAGFGEARR